MSVSGGRTFESGALLESEFIHSEYQIGASLLGAAGFGDRYSKSQIRCGSGPGRRFGATSPSAPVKRTGPLRLQNGHQCSDSGMNGLIGARNAGCPRIDREWYEASTSAGVLRCVRDLAPAILWAARFLFRLSPTGLSSNHNHSPRAGLIGAMEPNEVYAGRNSAAQAVMSVPTDGVPAGGLVFIEQVGHSPASDVKDADLNWLT